MSTDRDVNRIVRSWLEEGAAALPDRVLDEVLDQLPATPQRRSWWPARRFADMNTPLRMAVAAAAVVAIAVVGLTFLPREGQFGAPNPTPSPSPTPTVSPAPAALREGPLPAGTYTLQPFTGPLEGRASMCFVPPQSGCTESVADDSIRVTFAVPAGWTGFSQAIAPTVESIAPPGGAALIFQRGGWIHSKLCSSTRPDIPTGTTVDEFVNALVDHPDLNVTSPLDVTLAGYSGKYLELQAPANIAADQDRPKAGECAYYFVWEPGIYAQGPNQLWHVWVVDVDGVRVVIRMDTFPGTTPKVQAELQSIVDSIQIEP